MYKKYNIEQCMNPEIVDPACAPMTMPILANKLLTAQSDTENDSEIMITTRSNKPMPSN